MIRGTLFVTVTAPHPLYRLGGYGNLMRIYDDEHMVELDVGDRCEQEEFDPVEIISTFLMDKATHPRGLVFEVGELGEHPGVL